MNLDTRATKTSVTPIYRPLYTARTALLWMYLELTAASCSKVGEHLAMTNSWEHTGGGVPSPCVLLVPLFIGRAEDADGMVATGLRVATKDVTAEEGEGRTG